ncbi:MAG: sigma-70 family RNA polymerase sigma factor [Saprospiraceae bacterium]|nr:sigma-70 family RNA polymerase sigma factor [Candidatus Brachybacter algidus]MBK8844136.1 sigma-70 family RNA polymerase sigma factor [Candidatus Brachybacter algidus]MBP7306000.1 sigma-70 family RNA polymerase sigma factor [Saprospiraceae bacterium]HQW70241.1 sigma-70 family RNA polymerase sigma factor [Saprospiraceae bacterium]
MQNDRQSQKQLYERYSEQMYAICFRYCRDEYKAREALQNGFIRVFNNLKSFNTDMSLGAWMRTIMINCSLDELKRNKKTENIEDNKFINQLSEPNLIDETMTAEEMMSLVNEMPEGYRTVFNMFIIDDLSHLEISQILGIAEATSRSQLSKARNYLKVQLLHKQKLYL